MAVSYPWCTRQEALSERMVGVLIEKSEAGCLRQHFVRCVGNITDDSEGPLLQPGEFVSKKQRYMLQKTGQQYKERGRTSALYAFRRMCEGHADLCMKRRMCNRLEALDTTFSMCCCQRMSLLNVTPSNFMEVTHGRYSSWETHTGGRRRTFLVTKFIIAHLSGLTGSAVFVDHLMTLSHSDCRRSSRGPRTKWRIVTSSAYLIIVVLVHKGDRLSRTMQKRRGPITLPCGTPDVTCAQDERVAFTLVRCLLFVRKFVVQSMASLGKLKVVIACRIDACGSLSKARLKSTDRSRAAPDSSSKYFSILW